ncbi:MAG: long-chain fatty acid--CoA ligase [Actinomycetia bacterium]|nr:long-chain fatty acid--CoA ligase [Actinomycetes bacterium]
MKSAEMNPIVGKPSRDETRTVLDRFWERVEQQPERTALRFRDGDRWSTISWGDYGTAVEETAGGLITLGLESGDRVGLLSANRPEWHIADLAVLSAGGVTVPVYPTSSSSQVAYVLENAGCRVCFVDDHEQLAKVLLHRDELPDLERVVVFAGAAGLDRTELLSTLDQLRSNGGDAGAVADRVAALSGDDLATLVYTSGTTGPPKGTMLTHGNIEWTIESVESMIGLSPDDRLLSYLPLSHIAERVTSHLGQIASGGETWFARSLVTVPDDLRACRPTIFLAVPRVWQKLHDVILDELDSKPVHLSGALDHAATSASRDTGDWSVRSIADRASTLVIEQTLARAVRHKLGLDRARFIASAAAPIHPDLVRWFHGIGLPIAEVYGQTEDCGPATMNPPDAIRIGSVGKAIPGLEVTIADDGEVLVRGGSVCAGYYRMPDATAELIDDDSWMYTGDLGRIDDDGYLWLTGRKKDLIINSAGKNIAPAEIESRLGMEPLIGQAVVVGDGRKYLTALFTLDADAVADWAEDNDACVDPSVLARDPRLHDEVAESVERANRAHAPVEQIKYWRILPEALTVENGEMTPTFKVKRNVVQANFADLIEAMYIEGG